MSDSPQKKLDEAFRELADFDRVLREAGPVPPCPACVSEYGAADAQCPHCGGSGRCPSADSR